MHLGLFLFFAILLGFVSSLAFKDVSPNVLAGFKHVNASFIVEHLMSFRGDEEKHLHMCMYFYCHYGTPFVDHLKYTDGDRSAGCIVDCVYLQGLYLYPSQLAAKENLYKHLINTQPAKNQLECTEKLYPNCDIFDGYKLCKSYCESLCKVQFQFKNRKEYEEEFIELVKRLKKIGAMRTVTCALLFFSIFTMPVLAQEDGYEEYTYPPDEDVYSDKYHGYKQFFGFELCEELMGKKKEGENALRKLRCQSDCGQRDCTSECHKLCVHQFEFWNRKEYEAEFLDLQMRLQNDGAI